MSLNSRSSTAAGATPAPSGRDPRWVCFPPDPNPRRPRLKLPAGAWDTHFHAVGPPHLFPYDEAHQPFFSPAAPIEHYLKVAAVLGFERGVVVHPTFHGRDNAVTLDAIRKSDGRLRGIVIAAAEMDDAEISRLHAAGIRGVRFEFRNLTSFDERSFERLVARLARHRWLAAMHVDPQSLLRLAEILRRLPVVTIIENYASIDARLGLDQPALRCMLDLAGEPHVWLKAASAYRMVALRGATEAQVLPIARAVHARSPDRAIWGTDWPNVGFFAPGKVPNCGDLVDSLLDYVPDETMRRKLLVDNPKRLFDFD